MRHGYSPKGKRHPLYAVWANMKTRCNSPTDKSYASYGGRGIKVCEKWVEFPGFLEDMGERPSLTHTLDRIDVNGDYCKENCRWATYKEQNRNRRSNVLNQSSVRGIRCLIAAGVSKKRLATAFGVAVMTIYDLKKSWK